MATYQPRAETEEFDFATSWKEGMATQSPGGADAFSNRSGDATLVVYLEPEDPRNLAGLIRSAMWATLGYSWADDDDPWELHRVAPASHPIYGPSYRATSVSFQLIGPRGNPDNPTREHWDGVYDKLAAEREAKRAAGSGGGSFPGSLHKPAVKPALPNDFPSREKFVTTWTAEHGGPPERWNRVYNWFADEETRRLGHPPDGSPQARRGYIQAAMNVFGGTPERWGRDYDTQVARNKEERGDGRPPDRADFVMAMAAVFREPRAKCGAAYDYHMAEYRKRAGLT